MKYMENKSLKITLPNGIELSGFSSESQMHSALSEIISPKRKKEIVKEKKAETVKKEKTIGKKKYKHSRKFLAKQAARAELKRAEPPKKLGARTKVAWTEIEDLFLSENTEKGIDFLSRSFLADRHTKRGIKDRWYEARKRKAAEMPTTNPNLEVNANWWDKK